MTALQHDPSAHAPWTRTIFIQEFLFSMASREGIIFFPGSLRLRCGARSVTMREIGVGSCSNKSPCCAFLLPGFGAVLPLSVLLQSHSGGWIARPATDHACHGPHVACCDADGDPREFAISG